MIYDLRSKVLYIFLIVLILLFSFSLFYYLHSSENELQVSFLNVGQGDSILIETPQDRNILVDGGPDDKVLTGLGRNLPFWERSIDLAILTHPHRDHLSGLLQVMERYKTERVLYTGVEYSSRLYKKWKELLRGEDVDIKFVQERSDIRLGQDCRLRILHPSTDKEHKEVSKVNNSSIVSRLSCAGRSFLLTGDIESGVKNKLASSSAQLGSEVLKLSHHGAGERSENGSFLEQVSPEVAVASVGENDHGHPDKEYLEQLRKRGIKVLRTDKKGTIIFTKDEEGSFIDLDSHNWKDIFY